MHLILREHLSWVQISLQVVILNFSVQPFYVLYSSVKNPDQKNSELPKRCQIDHVDGVYTGIWAL